MMQRCLFRSGLQRRLGAQSFAGKNSSSDQFSTIAANFARSSHLHQQSFKLNVSKQHSNSSSTNIQFISLRCFSQETPKKGFITNLLDSIRDEMQKNKSLEENLKKLKEETQKLEQSDALQKAREKYQIVEEETFKSSKVLKEKLEELRAQIGQRLEDAKKTDIGRRGVELGENVVKTAREAAETLSKSADVLSANPAYKSVAEGMKTVKKEIEEITLADARLYKKPVTLRKRQDTSSTAAASNVTPNTEATGITLTKESRFYARWKDFVDNNPYYNKFVDLKMSYDESDHRLVRMSRFVTDKVYDAVTSMFGQTNISEVLTELSKVDPEFNSEKFLRDCELEFIPNVLEASLSGEMDVLKDWCYERSYATLSHLYNEGHRAGYILKYRILDIDNLTLEGGMMSEMGPVLVVHFRSQQMRWLATKEGKVTQGNPEEILLITHVWAFCRDMEELNPAAAWKVLEAHEAARPMLM